MRMASRPHASGRVMSGRRAPVVRSAVPTPASSAIGSNLHSARNLASLRAPLRLARSVAVAAASASFDGPSSSSDSLASIDVTVSMDNAPPAGAEGRRVVIVGGGWAGFGAAKHLAEQGYDVTLLEAAPNPGGLSGGFRTASGKAVEAGMKGFWFQYRNTFKLIEDLNLPSWPLTDFTTSGFWNPKGLVTEAPVFSKLPRLPTLVGQFVHTFPLYWALPLEDRLTMLPFLATLADYVSSEERFEQYDKMSAYELFRRCGVSTRCYNEFLRPTLLVGLFAPPEDLSAAAVLETLYFYALAHQNDFDVCWPKGSIAETIFTPLVERIRAAGGRVQGNRLVTGVDVDPSSGEVTSVRAADRTTGELFTYPADALVFAVGITGMQKLITATPALASQPDFRSIMELRALDVIATRIWFDRRVATRYPANVLSGFEPTAGATFFNLNDLQDEYKDAPGSVISADFYHANALLPLSDEQIVQRVVSHISTCEPGFKSAQVVDSVVLRYPKAVTHFSPGSYPFRPFQATTIPNLFMAGDWVKGVPHGANGLSQERAYVTGLSAANLVVQRLGLGSQAEILDVEPDEPHIAAARAAVRGAVEFAGALGLKSPFL
ncbi:hypothetical protein HYH03_004842 [Edaphochlamys debaryana]|uniref:Amine oxidase domain-containing protein n=1 Tax=Edaphochlamys debaryana TaxID=47281 RepID=A0A835Y9J8_9CHLO|nr:hypothetical protein HYH03_004842 [Edaphochlamys debaryana]|eukprot:KAG2497258.1 hypothetical protein HYH03_004842 [Edaphochlamys debaryana]